MQDKGPQDQVKLTEGRVFKLEKGKNYLIVFDNRVATKNDIRDLIEATERKFECSILGFALRGDLDHMEIVEVPKS